MQTFRIDKINWGVEPDEPQMMRIQYRKAPLPDIPSNYVTAANSTLVNTDGVFASPVLIDDLEPYTDYVIRYTNLAGGSPFSQNIRSTLPITVGDFLSKTEVLIPNMQYIDEIETGLLDSCLPEPIGCLYTLSGNFRDILDQFGNAQYSVVDTDEGIAFVKRNNEIGIQVTGNVASLTPDPTDETGNNEASVLGADGTKSYSMGIWVNFTETELAQTGVDGKMWLIYIGDPNQHMGLYINTSTKYVHWIHKNGASIEEVVLDRAVEANKWNRIFIRRNGSDLSDAYNNQILMKIDSGYYSPSSPTYFSSSTIYNGRIEQPIYLGMGKQDSNGNIIPTLGVFKYFYYRDTLTDNNLRERVLNPPYPKVIICNPDLSEEFEVTHEHFATLTNNKVSWVLPHDVPTGEKKWFYRTYANERTKHDVTIVPFTKLESPYTIDFSDSEDLIDNAALLTDKFYALHKAWGGYANGGVVGENIYFQDGRLVLECHGKGYDGNIQGVERNGLPKLHTIQDDPIWGTDPKYGEPWTERVGCCIVSKDYYGFGRYLVRTKIPQQLGVAPAWWTFHYEEVYPETPDYELLLAEGLKREGSFNDGYYVVRNHEIDIEQPSHLAMGVFNGWTEVANNVIFFDVNEQYHIGIQNDMEANNGLWRLVDTESPNSQSSWIKVGTVVAERGNPDFGNLKCNTWIGETGSGNGWRFKDPQIPDSQNDEVYFAALTPIGQMANDGEFHDYEWRWYKDRVEFYFDGELKQINTAFIPDIPSRLTIGVWFPSGTSSNGTYAPWEADPTKTWAGMPADWNYQKMIVEKIVFEPYDDLTAGGSNRLIGESYPWDGMKGMEIE